MDERNLEFIDRFGMVFEQFGGARSAGMIWGWLIMSAEPQSLDDLANGLSLSKASVSLHTRLLEQIGIIERVSVRGDRKTYYQASERAWDLAIDFGIRKFEMLTGLAKEGLPIASDPKVIKRLEDMQGSLGVIFEEYKLLVERLRNRNQESEK